MHVKITRVYRHYRCPFLCCASANEWTWAGWSVSIHLRKHELIASGSGNNIRTNLVFSWSCSCALVCLLSWIFMCCRVFCFFFAPSALVCLTHCDSIIFRSTLKHLKWRPILISATLLRTECLFSLLKVFGLLQRRSSDLEASSATLAVSCDISEQIQRRGDLLMGFFFFCMCVCVCVCVKLTFDIIIRPPWQSILSIF